MKNYSKYLKKKSNVIFLFHGVIDKNPFKIRNYTKKHLLKKEFLHQDIQEQIQEMRQNSYLRLWRHQPKESHKRYLHQKSLL